jgi:hypothetical protein
MTEWAAEIPWSTPNATSAEKTCHLLMYDTMPIT